MQIAVCDDNFEEMQLVIAELNKVSIQLNTEYAIYEFQNKQDLFDTLKDKEIEVVLLDIDMPGESGIVIANEICVLYPMLSIIFVTNHDELVFTALRCNPFRFVRKNHMKEEIFEAMSSLEIKLSKEMFIFDFTRGKDSYKFRIQDISYIESSGHYIEIHVANQMYRMRGKISAYENKLEELGFLRIHIGYLVNVRYIFKLSSEGVVLNDMTQLPISRKRIDEIKLKYADDVERFVHGIHI